MATYYSHLLNRAISYDKKLITPKEIQAIIDYIFDFGTSKYRKTTLDVFKWNTKNKIYIFHTHEAYLNKKQKYYIDMCEKIYIMFLNAESGEKNAKKIINGKNRNIF